jgi:hypothetical protein
VGKNPRDGRARAGFVEHDQPAVLGPRGDDIFETVRLAKIGHGQTAALFGSLDHDGAQPRRVEPLRIGPLGPDRDQRRDAQFGRLLRDQIERSALDRREDQPQVGVGHLRPQAFAHGQRRAALAHLVEFGQPFAILAIEQGKRLAPGRTQNVQDAVRLTVAQCHRYAFGQWRVDVKTMAWHDLVGPLFPPDGTIM